VKEAPNPPPKPEPKLPTYADKGDHGKRHEYQEQVKQAQKSCDYICGECLIAKFCTKV
jgi:hypothetical protein